MKNHHLVLIIIAVLGTMQMVLGIYVLGREKVAPVPQKQACQITSNGMTTDWFIDGYSVRVVGVE